MISGYVLEGSVGNAFNLFQEIMIKFEPNSVILMVILPACCAGRGLITSWLCNQEWVSNRGVSAKFSFEIVY